MRDDRSNDFNEGNANLAIRGFAVAFTQGSIRGRLSGTVTAFQVWNSSIVNDVTELDPATGMKLFSRVQSGEHRSRDIEVDATLTTIDNWQTYLFSITL